MGSPETCPIILIFMLMLLSRLAFWNSPSIGAFRNCFNGCRSTLFQNMKLVKVLHGAVNRLFCFWRSGKFLMHYGMMKTVLSNGTSRYHSNQWFKSVWFYDVCLRNRFGEKNCSILKDKDLIGFVNDSKDIFVIFQGKIVIRFVLHIEQNHQRAELDLKDMQEFEILYIWISGQKTISLTSKNFTPHEKRFANVDLPRL
jgi:hypothetical protein